jgi:hypothetical protein
MKTTIEPMQVLVEVNGKRVVRTDEEGVWYDLDAPGVPYPSLQEALHHETGTNSLSGLGQSRPDSLPEKDELPPLYEVAR